MDEQQFKSILFDITKMVLADMIDDKYHPNKNKEHFPTTYDINCGYCEEWMLEVIKVVNDAEEQYDDEIRHLWIFYEGKHYDAECLDGVDNQFDLPIYKNQNRTRQEVLQERI